MSAAETWAPQVAVTVIAEVREGRERALEGLLHSMGDGVSNERVIAFGELSGVHFARLVLVPPVDPRDASTLIFMSDVDGARDDHLGELAERHGEGLDAVFGHCSGYPEHPATSPSGSPSCVRVPCAPTRVTSTGPGAPSPRCGTRRCARRDRDLPRHGPFRARALHRTGCPGEGAGICRGRSAARVRAHPRAGAGARRARARCARSAAAAGDAARALAAPDRRRAALDRLAAHPRAPRPGPGHPPRPGQRGHDRRTRGPPGPESVYRPRPGEARPVPAPDRDRPALDRRLGHAAPLRKRRPGRHQDDPLRPLGLPRRQAPPDLREQLRRQPRELHGRLHRQGGVGPERDLHERRRLSPHELALLRRREGRAGVQALHAHASDADACLVLGVRRSHDANIEQQRRDPRRSARQDDRRAGRAMARLL